MRTIHYTVLFAFLLFAYMSHQSHIEPKKKHEIIWKSRKKMIVFRAPSRGQGIGNCLHGLITAYTLGEMFQRDVCIQWSRYTMFSHTKTTCPNTKTVLKYFNFGKSHTKKEITSMLKRHDVVALESNRVWNISTRFPNLFEDFCNQFNVATYNIVAHIRTGDNYKDRRGILLKENGWDILRKCLPNDTYIISDNLKTFTTLNKPSRRVTKHSEIGGGSKENLKQTWYDWCTFRKARKLYYTPSGFSDSSVYLSHSKEVIKLDKNFNC